MKLASLVSLKPLKEMASRKAQELADSYSLEQLQSRYDQIWKDMEQEAEPEGGPIADQYADELHAYEEAIQVSKQKIRGGSSRGSGPDGEMTYDDMLKKHYPDRMNESTEPKWNAIDVSRKAEKEIDNKEWNERTTKKLDMLKSLNKAGKFKKDWDEEKLQGWVDENYSWEKLSRQFKLNESYSSMFEQGNTVTATAYVLDEPKQVTIKSTGLHNPVTINWEEPWGEESHTVDFEYEENLGGSEAYDECNTVIYSGESNIFTFSLEVCVDPNPNNEEIWDYDWNDLSIDKKGKDVEEGSCGYTQTAPGGKDLKTPGGTQGMEANKRTITMMREVVKKEIKKLYLKEDTGYSSAFKKSPSKSSPDKEKKEPKKTKKGVYKNVKQDKSVTRSKWGGKETDKYGRHIARTTHVNTKGKETDIIAYDDDGSDGVDEKLWNSWNTKSFGGDYSDNIEKATNALINRGVDPEEAEGWAFRPYKFIKSRVPKITRIAKPQEKI